MEIDRFLTQAESGQRFDYGEFVDCVVERTGADRGDAVYQARVLVGLLGKLVPATELAQVDAQLPEEYDPLFELVELPEE